MFEVDIPVVGNTWNDLRVDADYGEESPDPIFLEVGKFLTQWEHLEAVLANYFALFVSSDISNQAASRAYGAIKGSTSRIDMLEHALEIFADRSLYPGALPFPADDMKRLLKHVRAGFAIRNQIAHGLVIEIAIEGTKRGFFLVPSMYMSSSNKAHTKAFWDGLSEDPFDVFGFNYRYNASGIYALTKQVNWLTDMAIKIQNNRMQVYVEAQMQGLNQNR